MEKEWAIYIEEGYYTRDELLAILKEQREMERMLREIEEDFNITYEGVTIQ